MPARRRRPRPFPHSLRALVPAALLALAVVAGIAVWNAPLGHAQATFTVTSTADTVDAAPGDGVCADAAGLCTLRAAVQEANALAGADTILLQPGTYVLAIVGAGNGSAASGDLDLTDDVTIDGARGSLATIDAAAIDRIFDIEDPVTVEIRNVTLINGRAQAAGGTVTAGGAIRNLAGTLTLLRVDMRESVSDTGGAIHNGGTLTWTTGTAQGNSAENSGGGLFNTGTATLNSVVLQGNTADAGGGIQNVGGTLTVDASAILANFATGIAGKGGGIGNANGATATLLRSRIEGNTSVQSFGGGAWNNATLEIVTSTIAGNSADADGGGLYNDGGVLSLTRSTVSGNTSADQGAGIANTAGASTAIVNSTMSGNTAQEEGGGIFNVAGGDNVVTLVNSTVAANNASDGAAIATGTAAQTTLTNTILAGGGSGTLCGGTGGVLSGGGNLDQDGSCALGASADQSNIDPLLGPLALNGGPTATHALLPGSPAIDAALSAACPVLDQRGVFRFGQPCDIGAFEVNGVSISIQPNPGLLIGNTESALNLHLVIANQGPHVAQAVTITSTVPDHIGIDTGDGIVFDAGDGVVVNGANCFVVDAGNGLVVDGADCVVFDAGGGIVFDGADCVVGNGADCAVETTTGIVVDTGDGIVFDAGDGLCTWIGRTLTCTVADLEPGATAGLDLTLRNTWVGEETLRFAVAALGEDPAPADDTADVDFAIVPFTEREVALPVTGWILLGWPGTQPIPPADAFSGIGDDLSIALTWDAAGQRFRSYGPGLPAVLNTLQALRPNDGFWLYMDGTPGQARSLLVRVVDAARSVALSEGFNLVLWGGPDEMPVAEAVASLGDAVRSVQTWDVATQSFRTFRPTVPAAVNSARVLRHGDGVWIDVDRATTWEQPAP